MDVVRWFLRRQFRPIATAVMLAVAVVSSAQCLAGASMTAEQKACCAAMHGDCGEMAIASSCCTGEGQGDQSLVAMKPAAGFVPVAALLAILSAPAVSLPASPRPLLAAERSSAGPPGVPTYLFVSSLRI